MHIYPRHSIRLSLQLFREALSYSFQNPRHFFEEIVCFEKEFSHYIGCPYALAVPSARSGLSLALKAYHFSEKDEVIMPAYTFLGLPLVVMACNVTPVFVDIDPRTYTISAKAIEQYITSRTKAILVTHMFGQPCDMKTIVRIARQHKLKLIEDCAHACGAAYEGKKVGTFGDVGLFSFNMGKNMPCFGGGMLSLQDQDIYKKIKEAINLLPFPSSFDLFCTVVKTGIFSLLTSRYVFPWTLFPFLLLMDFLNLETIDEIMEEHLNLETCKASLKCQKRFSSLQAYIGRKQLPRLDQLNAQIRHNADLFSCALKGVPYITMQQGLHEVNTLSAHLYYTVQVANRSRIRKKLRLRGIDTKRDDMSVCKNLEMAKDYNRPCPYAEALKGRNLEIPNSPYFSQKDIEYIMDTVKDICSK